MRISWSDSMEKMKMRIKEVLLLSNLLAMKALSSKEAWEDLAIFLRLM